MRKIILMISIFSFVACGGDQKKSENKEKAKTEEKTERRGRKKNNKGIGPITELKLPETIDEAMVKEGKEIFDAKCTACHKPTTRYVGPAPKGIMKRRSPEWIMNMILNPEEMIKKDPIAKQLLRDYNGATMSNQNLTEDESRKILEYFRTLE